MVIIASDPYCFCLIKTEANFLCLSLLGVYLSIEEMLWRNFKMILSTANMDWSEPDHYILLVIVMEREEF